METKSFSFSARARSFICAWNGIKAMFRTEHNAYIHLAMSLLAAGLGIFFHISKTEVLALGIVMTLVWMAEIFNTAIEKTMDFISTETHPQIRLVKDLAAAAVLVTAVVALLTGGIVFIPKFF